MALDPAFVHSVLSAPPADAWAELFKQASAVWADPLPTTQTAKAATKREQAVAELDHLLCGAAWSLWSEYEDVVPRTAATLGAWWSSHPPGRAVLILDGLSLRELPWLLQEAPKHGLELVSHHVTGAELPGETTPFARALGVGQRSALENDGVKGKSHALAGARTDTSNLPFEDCVPLVSDHPDWVFWHHWPDEHIHEMAVAGQGFERLVEEASIQLTSDAFWAFVRRLAEGRRLVITSDHGYAASGHFQDTPDKGQTTHLQQRFGAGRSRPIGPTEVAGPWTPPLDLVLDTTTGPHALALGRRKWKIQGGYPTLGHGGLTLLEVAAPFVELSLAGST